MKHHSADETSLNQAKIKPESKSVILPFCQEFQLIPINFSYYEVVTINEIHVPLQLHEITKSPTRPKIEIETGTTGKLCFARELN